MAPHPLKFEQLEDHIIKLREQPVLLDADVAELYDVETRDINKAVANNPDKFPEGYVAQLSKREKRELVENFHRFHRLKHSTVNPKAFPEKGLYMLATILKSPRAVQATLAIIETFTKVRQLGRSIQVLSIEQDKTQQKELMQRSGELITGLFDDDLQATDSETTIELNFAVLKFKHTIKKKQQWNLAESVPDRQKEIRWRQRYANLRKAYGQLQRGLALAHPNEIEQQGIIQSFEFTFELAWKTLQDYMEARGGSAVFPRDVIKQAFQADLIENGACWLDMLSKRKLLAHTYDESLAQTADDLIRDQYSAELAKLMNWLESQTDSEGT